MKYTKQLAIILSVSLVGELLRALLPLPIPASIYGMLLMLTALCTGVVKLEQVRETGKFLVAVMTLFFIPSTVGLMEKWGDMRQMLLPLIIISVVSLLTTFAASGWVTQALMRRKAGKHD